MNKIYNIINTLSTLLDEYPEVFTIEDKLDDASVSSRDSEYDFGNQSFYFEPDFPVMIIKVKDIDWDFGYNIHGFTLDPQKSTLEKSPEARREFILKKYIPTQGFEDFYNKLKSKLNVENIYDQKLKDYENSLDKPDEPERDHSEDREDDAPERTGELDEIVKYYLKK